MFDKSKTVEPCDCHMVEILADTPGSSVEFDTLTKSYSLVRKDGGSNPLYHCFFCGGRLPEADFSFIPKIDEKEEEEARKIMKTIKTKEDLFRELGVPDETFDDLTNDSPFQIAFAKYYPDGNVEKWDHCFRFTTRWRTLLLDVMEFRGQITRHFAVGKPNGYVPVSMLKPPKRWWQLW